MDLKVVALSVLLLFLCPDVSGYRVQKRAAQEKSQLAQLQETAQGYWDQIASKTRSWYDAFSALEFNVQARETGQKVKEALSTYTNILWDQTQAWWNDQ